MPKARANGIELEYETFGEGEPLLLIMGLGAQMTAWPQGLIDRLVGQGLQVIRFDNRDVGLSTKLDDAGPADLPGVFAALKAGEKPNVAYVLDDMAADAAGLLDALEIDRAHIVGASLGGMVAQLVAADYPHKTRSLTSIMSTSGDRSVPGATKEAAAVLNVRGPDPTVDLEGFLAHSVKNAGVTGSPAYPADPQVLRERAIATFQRMYYPAGFGRQYAAAIASPGRRPKLATITAPTVVIHGAADPLVPPEGGRDTADHVPGAELVEIEGMGHDIPEPLFDEIAGAIMKAVRRSRATA